MALRKLNKVKEFNMFKKISKKALIYSFIALLNLSLVCAQDNPYKVGIMIPLSGVAAEYGVAIKNGVTMALEDHKAEVNSCEFIYEDTEYNSAKTVTSFHRLADSDIDLVYAFGGPMSEVLAPLAEAKKIPLMSDGIDPKVAVGKDFVVRNTNTGLEYGGTLAKYLLDKGVKRIAIVKAENQYLNSLVAGFLEGAGGKFEVVDLINVIAENSDFKPVVPKLLRGEYDAIGLFMFPGQSSSLSRLFKGREDKFLFFGSDFMESQQEITASLGVLEGAVYPNNFVSAEFKDRYLAKFNSDSQLKFAGEGYDVISLVINTICSKNKKVSSKEAISLIKSVKSRSGVLGETVYTETSDGDKYFKAPVYVMQVSASGFKPVK